MRGVAGRYFLTAVRSLHVDVVIVTQMGPYVPLGVAARRPRTHAGGRHDDQPHQVP